MNADDYKRAAAARAVEFVRPGMRLGLGTGSTARHFVELVGERVRAGLDVVLELLVGGLDGGRLVARVVLEMVDEAFDATAMPAVMVSHALDIHFITSDRCWLLIYRRNELRT